MKYTPQRMMLMLDAPANGDGVSRSAALDASVDSCGFSPPRTWSATASARWGLREPILAIAIGETEADARIQALASAVATMFARVFGNG